MYRPSQVVHSAPPTIEMLGQRIARIAYATDLNNTHDCALLCAIQIAKANGADLLLLHVLPPPVPLFEAEPFEKSGAEIALSLLLKQLTTIGVRATGSLLTGTDSIGKQIVRVARLNKTDLIVVGYRNHLRRFRRLIAGSISGSVVAHAEGPVLVIPCDRVTTTGPIHA